MRSRLVRAILLLGANALGLFVASLVVEDLTLGWRTFIIAVAIFTVAEVLIQPLIERLVKSKAEAFAGGAALLTTFLGLVVTTIISDGIKITGTGTWILTTVIVWLVAVAAGILLPAVFLRSKSTD
jgi:putative membrane protein